MTKSQTPTENATSPDDVAIKTAANWLYEKIQTGRRFPRFVVSTNDAGHIAFKFVDDSQGAQALLCYALGSASFEFCHSIILQLINAPGTRASDPDGIAYTIHSGLSFIAKNEPTGELETMLLVQAWMTHQALLTRQRSLASAETIEQLDANGRLVVKLGRLFTQQMETLARMRTAGKQVIEVQHVHIYPGAQAVLGDVHTGGGGIEKRRQPEALADLTGLALAPESTVWSEDTGRDVVREPRGQEQASLPDARVRSRRRRAERTEERPVQDRTAHARDGGGSQRGARVDAGDEGFGPSRLSHDASDRGKAP
jgi:hypothetical protein